MNSIIYLVGLIVIVMAVLSLVGLALRSARHDAAIHRRDLPHRGHRRAAAADIGYVDWPAIFAGTALAVALSFVLLTFGSAIGLSVASFEPGEGASLNWLAIASGLWFIWVAITSFARRRLPRRPPAPAGAGSERSTRSRCATARTAIVVWAVGALLGAILAASGITGVVGAAGKAAGTAAQTAGEAVGGDVELPRRPPAARRTAATPPAVVLTRNLADGDVSAEDRDYLVVARRRAHRPDPRGSRRRRSTRPSTEAQAFYAEALADRRAGPRRRRHRRLRHRRHLMASAAADWPPPPAATTATATSLRHLRPPAEGVMPALLPGCSAPPPRDHHRLPDLPARLRPPLQAAASSAWCLASSASAFCITLRTPRAAWRMRCSFSTRPRRT